MPNDLADALRQHVPREQLEAAVRELEALDTMPIEDAEAELRAVGADVRRWSAAGASGLEVSLYTHGKLVDVWCGSDGGISVAQVWRAAATVVKAR
jgi:hypothetical protein